MTTDAHDQSITTHPASQSHAQLLYQPWQHYTQRLSTTQAAVRALPRALATVRYLAYMLHIVHGHYIHCCRCTGVSQVATCGNRRCRVRRGGQRLRSLSIRDQNMDLLSFLTAHCLFDMHLAAPFAGQTHPLSARPS